MSDLFSNKNKFDIHGKNFMHVLESSCYAQ